MARRISLSIASGLMLALSFPPAQWSGLVFIGLIPLILAVDQTGMRRSFFLGWLSGIVYFTVVLWWVTNAVINYGYLPVPVGWAVLFLMTSILAVYPGVFAVAAGRMTWWKPSARLTAVVLLPALWTALEWIRGNLFFTAFPWANLAYSQYLRLPFIQSASIAGPYGPGFLIVAVNVGFIHLWRAFRPGGVRRTAHAVSFALVAALFVLNWSWGMIRLGVNPTSGDPLEVAVLQGNVPQEEKWDREYREAIMDNYSDLTMKAAEAGARLIIWPEAAAPFYYQADAGYRRRMNKLVAEAGRPVLFGAPAFETADEGVNLRNRAYYLDGKEGSAVHYDKIHLVPFGEYVPLAKLLFFAGKLVQEVGDFTPGEDFRLFATDGEAFGTVICYEIIFPDLVRRFANKGATFLTNITNDAWYGRTSASHQHFTQMVFRAVENGVPVARAANTGISGFVDGRGRILMMSELFERGFYIREIHPGRQKTFYTKHGDAFVWLCFLILAGAAPACLFGTGSLK